MRIIDAHLHVFSDDNERANRRAGSAGNQNSIDFLREQYAGLEISHGVIMGNGGLEPARHNYPSDILSYCVGLDSQLMLEGIPQREIVRLLEVNLERESCRGIKLYPGYNKLPLSDSFYEPVYRLAEKYQKPVAVHMGLTSMPQAHLKYCHPLALDEIAADHPEVSFVMCHFGSPFFESAAAVLAKNPNVSADLSGLLEGRLEIESYFEEQQAFIFMLKGWLAAARCWERIMYGTDWPIVNLGEYIEFIKRLVPKQHWEAVFFDNANRIYKLGL